MAGAVGLREVRYGYEGANHLDAETISWLQKHLIDVLRVVDGCRSDHPA